MCKNYAKIKALARRVNHSLEMRSWIKARTEMSVLLSGFFYTIGNFISYRIKKRSVVDAHSARRQLEIARELLPDGNRARREWCA